MWHQTICRSETYPAMEKSCASDLRESGKNLKTLSRPPQARPPERRYLRLVKKQADEFEFEFISTNKEIQLL